MGCLNTHLLTEIIKEKQLYCKLHYGLKYTCFSLIGTVSKGFSNTPSSVVYMFNQINLMIIHNLTKLYAIVVHQNEN